MLDEYADGRYDPPLDAMPPSSVMRHACFRFAPDDSSAARR